MRTADEIRNHFLELLNNSLHRLDMYGGGGFGSENFARNYLSYLTFIDEREKEYAELLNELHARKGVTAAGVCGAFFMRTCRDAMAGEIGSVYAELAFRLGYLKVERILKKADYSRMSKLVRRECKHRDWTFSEVAEEFGVSSWSSSAANPFYPCTTLYLFQGTPFKSIAFDFWNELDLKSAIEKTTGVYGEIQVLRDVRIHGKSFPSDFIITPIGKQIIQRAANEQPS